MLLTLLTGQLVLVDTDEGKIHLKNREDRTIQAIRLNQNLKNYPHNFWENLMGCDIEAVVTGDEAVNVYDVTEEENK